jgi:hypothetical protein
VVAGEPSGVGLIRAHHHACGREESKNHPLVEVIEPPVTEHGYYCTPRVCENEQTTRFQREPLVDLRRKGGEENHSLGSLWSAQEEER